MPVAVAAAASGRSKFPPVTKSPRYVAFTDTQNIKEGEGPPSTTTPNPVGGVIPPLDQHGRDGVGRGRG